MRARWLWVVVAALVVSAGCEPDLTVCDDDLARQPVFDVSVLGMGVPAYEGQALVQKFCANGFCHSSQAADRSGAPADLNWDMVLASSTMVTETCEPTPLCAPEGSSDTCTILQQGQANVSDYRHEIFSAVESGWMPPYGPETRGVFVDGPRWRRLDGSGLPAVDTPEGLDILENWLACGAPVIERTGGASTGIGDVVPRRELGAPPVEATWTSIWNQVLNPGCGSTCHGSTLPDQLMENRLDLSDKDMAYTALVGTGGGEPAMGSACEMSGVARVVPGDANASLLVQKLEGEPCGGRMPLGGTPLSCDQITAIRAWIDAGAMND